SHADRRSPRLPAAPSADRTIPGAGARPTPRHRAARGRRPRLAREGWLLAARPWSGASTRRPPRRRPRKSTRANFLSLGADVLEGSRRGLAELDRLALRESSAELIAIDLALHRIQHEVAHGPPSPPGRRTDLAMEVFRDVLHLEVPHGMPLASSGHAC